MNNRAGKEITNFSGETAYKSFLPAPLPPNLGTPKIGLEGTVALHNKNISLISRMGRAAKNTLRLLDYLEANPIIEISKTAEALGLAFNTTSDAIKRLEEAGILVQSAGQQRKKTGGFMVDCVNL